MFDADADETAEVIDIADQLLVLDDNGHVAVDQSPSKGAARAKYAQSMISQENLQSEEEEATQQAAIRRSQELVQRPHFEPATSPVNSRRRSLGLYKLFFGTIGYLRTVLWCFSMLVVSAGECAPEVYMRIWIDTDPNNNSYFIGYVAIASCTCVLFALVFASLCNHLTPRAALQLHSQLTRTVVGGTIAFLCAIDKGVLVNRFSQDMSLVVRNLPLAFMRTIYSQFRAGCIYLSLATH